MVQSVDRARQHGWKASHGKSLRTLGLMWLPALLACALLVAVAFVYLDVPIARHVYGHLWARQGLAAGLASSVLLSVEAAIVLALVISRITRGHLSPFREATALACLASICAYAINASILKVLFGVPNPVAVVQGAQHAFHLLGGSVDSSFPSGHMSLAGAFAGVFMRLYRVSILPLAVLLFLAAVVLVVGEWHFLSDVIAGTFVGVSAGLLAGEVWLAHSK